MHVLDRKGLPIPEILVLDDRSEVMLAKEYGLPFVVKPNSRTSDESIIKSLMYGIVQSMFPWVNIGKRNEKIVLEEFDRVDYEFAETLREGGGSNHGLATGDDDSDLSEELPDTHGAYRESLGGEYDSEEGCPIDEVSLEDMWKDGKIQVDAAQLMDAGLLPKILMDIGEAIRSNVSSYAWEDGYNRKLGTFDGEYQLREERPNLIVLDVSGSIPRGVSFTMIQLIETLRAQANADLIINSGTSQWWPANEPIDIDKVAAIVGGCNEATQFCQILDDHVLGRKWGTVIGFGDWDSHYMQKWEGVGDKPFNLISPDKIAATEIGKVLSYHTCSSDKIAGYIRWTEKCKVDEFQFQPDSWCKRIRRWPA